MSLAHDGHTITCALCRVPLRAILVTETGLELGQGSINVGDEQRESVDCENCGGSLGTLDRVQAKYAELWGGST